MPAEKTESIILSVAPYRESSCILRLFTKTRGLLHCIAKGIRKPSGKTSTPVPLDRGFIMESLVYYKPNRDLHTLGGLHVSEFFPGVRLDITKSAIRDVALELYLKTIPQSDPHPELFDLLYEFLSAIDAEARRVNQFISLWEFINNYCLLMGFGVDAKTRGQYGIDTNDPSSLSQGDCLRVTERLLQYCRHHFEIREAFNSVEFLRSM